jgi:hypothetical protein
MSGMNSAELELPAYPETLYTDDIMGRVEYLRYEVIAVIAAGNGMELLRRVCS